MGSDTENLVVAAQQASRVAAVERLSLAKSADLELTLTVNRLSRPIVRPRQMKSMLALCAEPSLIGSVHHSPPSGSDARATLPLW